MSDAFDQLPILDRQRLVHMALKVSVLNPGVGKRGKHVFF